MAASYQKQSLVLLLEHFQVYFYDLAATIERMGSSQDDKAHARQILDDMERTSRELVGQINRIRGQIEESASTLEGNAQIKSDHVVSQYGFDCFADDTGLEVDFLNGAPGVRSARYAGLQATAIDNSNKLLKELEESDRRNSRFRTVISLHLNGKQYFFEGVCEGRILKEPKGLKGFGYDPIFQPMGFSESFAEMSMEQKGEISHRGRAVRQLIDFLQKEFQKSAV